MSVGTSDGEYFDNELDYWHDRLFGKPQRDFDAVLEPHKKEYLSNHSDLDYDQVVWPKDARGIEYLKTVNASDSKHGAGGMNAETKEKE